MKKYFLFFGLAAFCILFLSNPIFSQRYYRNAPADDYYDLNLTREQREEINRLDLELEKELTPLFSELRRQCIKLDQLELQENPSYEEIDKVREKIYRLEDQIAEKEYQHQQKIRSLLTERQKAVFDSYYGYRRYGYGRGLGRGYYGRGRGRMGWGCRPFRFQGRIGRGQARPGYYGYGRGAQLNQRFYRRGNFYRGRGAYGAIGPRYGRGPCGRGLGKFYNWRWNRDPWNPDK